MIADSITNRALYEGAWSVMKKAFDFIEKAKAENLPKGKYEIDGDAVYANVGIYDGDAAAGEKWEAHRKYIDVQYVISGCETMGWQMMDNYEGEFPYEEDRDVGIVYGLKGFDVTLTDDTFAIFFPQDIHQPLKSGKGEIRKVVVKIRTDMMK